MKVIALFKKKKIDLIIKIQPLNYSLTMPIYEPFRWTCELREPTLSLAIQQQKILNLWTKKILDFTS
jgi:hypothetical protein